MIKHLFFVVVFITVASINYAQQMSITTEKEIGESINLYIDAAEADREDVWIDLNNNGQQDDGERVTIFSSQVSYVLGSQEITLNGNITYLSCNGNQITSLDTSNNTALNLLYCDDNNLTSLDLSNNSNLLKLYCHENNLISLDLSSNSMLTFLNCRSNSITNLNITQNTNLEKLYCHNNQLTSLDLSPNVALKRLYCQNNNLETLNVANGNNANFSGFGSSGAFDARGNENLMCIKIDEGFAPTSSWHKGDQASWNVNCEMGTNNFLQEKGSLKIEPNPVKNTFTIQTTLKIKDSKIFNSQGGLMYRFKGYKADVGFLQKGIYFIRIKTNKGYLFKKILKE